VPPLASPWGGVGAPASFPQPAVDSIQRFAQIGWEVWTHSGRVRRPEPVSAVLWPHAWHKDGL